MKSADLDQAEQKWRRQLVILVVAGGVALAFLATALVWWWSHQGERATVQQHRAEQAIVSAEQLCAQVQELGGSCVVDVDALRGEQGQPGEPGKQGEDGEPGRPPTDAEVLAAVRTYFRAHPPAGPSAVDIAAAVAAYLTEHPPAPGRDGAPGQPGGQGPAPSAEQVAAAVRTYLTENPPPRGEPGAQGPGPTAEEIAAAVEAYLRANPLGCEAGYTRQVHNIATGDGIKEIAVCTRVTDSRRR